MSGDPRLSLAQRAVVVCIFRGQLELRAGPLFLFISFLSYTVCFYPAADAGEEHQAQEEQGQTGRGLADLQMLVSGTEGDVTDTEQLGEPPHVVAVSSL